MSRIPSGGGFSGYPIRVEPGGRVLPIGENPEADSQDTRRKAEEARREVERRRQQASVHPIQSQLARDEEPMNAADASHPANNASGAGWGLVVIGVVVIVLVIIAICR